jgi:hypothetical protein
MTAPEAIGVTAKSVTSKGLTSRNLTRRGMAAMIAPAVLPAAALPAAAQKPADSSDELSAARQQTQRNTEQLRATKVPVATEPSFSFRP